MWVLVRTASLHNLCFEQKYENYQIFESENFQFLEVIFSKYLNRRVFVMALAFRKCFRKRFLGEFLKFAHRTVFTINIRTY